jgi:hypothetical protein
MTVKLHKTIETYVSAANAGDPEKGSSCFSENATVLDEGETLRGRKSIRNWMVKTKKKYNHITKPLKFREQSGEAVMTAELSGTFEGSPITLEYHFKMNNNLIDDLRVIQPT